MEQGNHRTISNSEAKTQPHEWEAPGDYLLSVVVPAFNEAENVPMLYQRVSDVLQKGHPRRWELIFVDDGSRDATWAAICRVAEENPHVKGVRLSRNFGHQYAIWAGLEMAEGQAVVMMDCDLQHPVELIPLLIEKWREGFLVVKTLRQEDKGLGWFKRWSSRTFYRLFSFLSGVDLNPGLADFRLLDRRAMNELLRFSEEGLFLRGLTEWIGFASCALPYQPGKRLHGHSQYSLKRMIKLGWGGVSSFSIMPLRIGILIGLIGSLFSALGILYSFFGRFIGKGVVPGWASTLMVISLLFFLLFIYLGVLGEYIGRMVVEVRRRPRFIVSEMKGFPGRHPLPHD
jgi:polyisoprenyl-phosphate glycosyltransferase